MTFAKSNSFDVRRKPEHVFVYSICLLFIARQPRCRSSLSRKIFRNVVPIFILWRNVQDDTKVLGKTSSEFGDPSQNSGKTLTKFAQTPL